MLLFLILSSTRSSNLIGRRRPRGGERDRDFTCCRRNRGSQSCGSQRRREATVRLCATEKEEAQRPFEEEFGGRQRGEHDLLFTCRGSIFDYINILIPPSKLNVMCYPKSSCMDEI